MADPVPTSAPRSGGWIDPERRRSLRSWRLALALALALLATWLTGQLPLLGAGQRPWALLLAFPLGHLLFAGSVALNRLSWRAGRGALTASLRLLYRPYGGETLLFYLLLALAEELLFRALPLSWLLARGPVHPGWVLGLALLFVLVHGYRPGRRGSPLLLGLDLFLLALVLGLFFLATGDLWPLVIAHAVRNGSLAKVLVRKDRLAAARQAGGRGDGVGEGRGES